ncbi:FAD-dependent monooxygenase [Brevibacterium casei]|nr:FAD-dependent monooxygenase [Brevibacterium casei]
MADIEVPVLIIGGGGAGLSASMNLSKLGVDHLLVSSLPYTSKRRRPTCSISARWRSSRSSGWRRRSRSAHPSGEHEEHWVVRRSRRRSRILRSSPRPPRGLGRRLHRPRLHRGECEAHMQPSRRSDSSLCSSTTRADCTDVPTAFGSITRSPLSSSSTRESSRQCSTRTPAPNTRCAPGMRSPRTGAARWVRPSESG